MTDHIIPKKPTDILSKVGNAAVGGTSALTSAAETDTFIASMTALQTNANAATLATAGLTNTKSLMDGLGKVIKGQGDSVKDAAPR